MDWLKLQQRIKTWEDLHTEFKAWPIRSADLAAVPSDSEQIEGPLPALLDDAVRFLRAHLRTPHHIRGFDSETYPELPEEALRETLVNALAHRDYTIPAPVRLFVFDDRVEVRTPI